jgi:hypothetical protein
MRGSHAASSPESEESQRTRGMSPPATEGTTSTGITGHQGPTYWPSAGGPPVQSRGAAGAERSELALDGTRRPLASCVRAQAPSGGVHRRRTRDAPCAPSERQWAQAKNRSPATGWVPGARWCRWNWYPRSPAVTGVPTSVPYDNRATGRSPKRSRRAVPTGAWASAAPSTPPLRFGPAGDDGRRPVLISSCASPAGLVRCGRRPRSSGREPGVEELLRVDRAAPAHPRARRD